MQCKAPQSTATMVKVPRKKYKEVIDTQRQSGTGIESDEEGTKADFTFMLS